MAGQLCMVTRTVPTQLVRSIRRRVFESRTKIAVADRQAEFPRAWGIPRRFRKPSMRIKLRYWFATANLRYRQALVKSLLSSASSGSHFDQVIISKPLSESLRLTRVAVPGYRVLLRIRI